MSVTWATMAVKAVNTISIKRAKDCPNALLKTVRRFNLWYGTEAGDLLIHETYLNFGAITITTRLFSLRPSSVSLLAVGR